MGAKAKPSPTQGPQNNRKLFLPRRPGGLRPGGVTEPSTEATAVEESKVEEEPEASETAPTTASSTEPAAPPQGLSSLIGARRRLPGRRPGLPRPAVADE